MNWVEARKHLYHILNLYESIGWTGTFALSVTINPLIRRFESGERTQELYNKIMSLE